MKWQLPNILNLKSNLNINCATIFFFTESAMCGTQRQWHDWPWFESRVSTLCVPPIDVCRGKNKGAGHVRLVHLGALCSRVIDRAIQWAQQYWMRSLLPEWRHCVLRTPADQKPAAEKQTKSLPVEPASAIRTVKRRLQKYTSRFHFCF